MVHPSLVTSGSRAGTKTLITGGGGRLVLELSDRPVIVIARPEEKLRPQDKAHTHRPCIRWMGQMCVLAHITSSCGMVLSWETQACPRLALIWPRLALTDWYKVSKALPVSPGSYTWPAHIKQYTLTQNLIQSGLHWLPTWHYINCASQYSGGCGWRIRNSRLPLVTKQVWGQLQNWMEDVGKNKGIERHTTSLDLKYRY